jgi:Tol biopolymer transport system component
MKKKFVLIVLALIMLCLCACNGGGGSDNDATGWRVSGITTIKEYGKSVDWLASENLIATARPLYDGYYDVVIFSLDGAYSETWLTHEAAGAPQKHNGNPAWHPSGKYIVFTAENEDVPDAYDIFAKPGRGVNCNLWLARADGSGFWPLTDIETTIVDSGGVIHPQFSPDGNQIFWAERIADNADTYWGQWVIKVAKFVVDSSGAPGLEDIKTYDPSAEPGFYESHAFSHDGQRIMFTGNLKEGQHETGMDIYVMDLQTEDLTRLTPSLTDWDEHAHWSPDGEQIVWMSSTDLDVTWPNDMGPLDWRYYLATELWIMDEDGSNPQRLTFFNEPDHPHNRASRTVVSDSSWSPDGNSLIVLVAHYDGIGPSSTASAELVRVTLQRE